MNARRGGPLPSNHDEVQTLFSLICGCQPYCSSRVDLPFSNQAGGSSNDAARNGNERSCAPINRNGPDRGFVNG